MDMGIEQTYIFPNPRSDSGARPPRDRNTNDMVKLVYFSRICEKKGFDIIMKAYRLWKRKNVPISLDFYGEVKESIKNQLERFVGGGDTATYITTVYLMW